MMNKEEILKKLVGDVRLFESAHLKFDLRDPEEFEEAYGVAQSMPDPYKTHEHYRPTFVQIGEAYHANDELKMRIALHKLCSDILFHEHLCR